MISTTSNEYTRCISAWIQQYLGDRLWSVCRFVVAGSGVTRATCSMSTIMYYNPQHMWGLPNEANKFTSEEVAENTCNEDDLHNVLRPIQVFGECYWVRLPKKKIDHLQRGYLTPIERPTCHISDKEIFFFLWHLFQDLQNILRIGKNWSYFWKHYVTLWQSYQTLEHFVPLPIHWGFNGCAHTKRNIGLQRIHLSPTNMGVV